MFDWIGDFFKELFSLIPKVIYLLYSSLVSVIDLIQALFRKLAGLDVYYVDGEPISGDIVTNFITGILGINQDNLTYSVLSTVFWSFVIFGLIICFLATLVAIVKSHYSYNEKSAKGPLPIVATAGKAVLNMIAVPVIVVLGLYLSEAILTALDDITSVGSSDITALYGDKTGEWLLSTDMYSTSRVDQEYDDSGNKVKNDSTYIYYDMFGYTGSVIYGLVGGATVADQEDLARVAARTQPFSGSIFKIAGYNANRVRTGYFGVTHGSFTGLNDECDLFDNGEGDPEVLAEMIDTAFANFLHLNDVVGVDADERYFTTFTTRNAASFSKFNVGLVWYYYDLWNFNFIVGFGAAIVCVSIFINIVFGLMSRLFMCVILFLVMPPLAGLAPIDDGKAFKGWREAFTKQVLMAYGAVVGMNLMLLILPYINEIDFFNITIADLFVQTLFIIVGLITIKAVISTLSGLIGAEDANAAGDKINKEVGSTLGKATAMTVGAAKLGGKAFATTAKLGGAAAYGLAKGGTALVGGIGGAIRGNGFVAGASKANRGFEAGVNAVGGAAKVAMRGLGNAAAFTKGFIKGGPRGAMAEARMRGAQNMQKEAEKDQWLQSINGQNMTRRQFINEAQAHGFTRNQAARLAREQWGANERGEQTIRSNDIRNNYLAHVTRTSLFGRYVAQNGGAGHGVTADMRAESAANRANRATSYRNLTMAHPGMVGSAIGGAFKTVGGIGSAMMGNYGTALKSTAGGKELRDAVMPSGPNWDKVNADNTAKVGEKMDALNKSITELANELRSRTP